MKVSVDPASANMVGAIYNILFEPGGNGIVCPPILGGVGEPENWI